MMKAFISQPMKGLTQTQITANRKAVVKKLNDAGYSIPPLLDLDTEQALDQESRSLKYLASSLNQIADCDFVVFMKGYNTARGCKLEFKAVKAYHKKYCMEADLDTFLRNIKEENHRISIFFRSQNY